MRFISIYGWSYFNVILVIVLCIIVFLMLALYISEGQIKILSIIGNLISVYGILSLTIFNRSPSDIHKFIVMADYQAEFFRELFMNVVLYCPLGVFLPFVVSDKRRHKRCVSILIGISFSVIVEVWQYITGAGTAQLTDILCNGLGIVICCQVYWIYEKFVHH